MRLLGGHLRLIVRRVFGLVDAPRSGGDGFARPSCGIACLTSVFGQTYHDGSVRPEVLLGLVIAPCPNLASNFH